MLNYSHKPITSFHDEQSLLHSFVTTKFASHRSCLFGLFPECNPPCHPAWNIMSSVLKYMNCYLSHQSSCQMLCVYSWQLRAGTSSLTDGVKEEVIKIKKYNWWLISLSSCLCGRLLRITLIHLYLSSLSLISSPSLVFIFWINKQIFSGLFPGKKAIDVGNHTTSLCSVKSWSHVVEEKW